jgi:hypothetical protein
MCGWLRITIYYSHSSLTFMCKALIKSIFWNSMVVELSLDQLLQKGI